MPRGLKATQVQLTDEVTDVQRVCGWVEAHVHADGARGESSSECFGIGVIMHEATCLEVGEEIHTGQCSHATAALPRDFRDPAHRVAYASPVATDEPALAEAFRRQSDACAALGSPQYAGLINELVEDVERGGLIHHLLVHRPEAPLRDALILRLLAGVHAVVLRGDAPSLASRYPSVGGDGGTVDVVEFLDVVDANRAEITDALGRTVQTNEVGRCAALVPAFADLARAHDLPLNMLEVGASAGLISNWDRYQYECFSSLFGPPSSAVRIHGRWDEPFDLAVRGIVVSRGACDIAPLSTNDSANRERLLSFVWPDQVERFRLLSNALDVADAHPPVVEQSDAADWLAAQLPNRPDGTLTIVFHSIVWQYLPRSTKERMRALLVEHGAQASPNRPLAWVRMEPAGPVADVRITTWPGGDERCFALASYHGAGVRRPR